MNRPGTAITRMAGVAAAQQLAHDLGLAEDLVMGAYERQIARIGGDAAVRQFVDLLAIKHVKAELAQQQRVKTPPR